MKKKLANLIDYMYIILGALIASFSVACILLPNSAIDYGTAGISIIISKLTGINLSLLVILIMIPFLILGLALVGREFFLRSLVGSVVYTLGLEGFNNLAIGVNTEHFLAVAFGGALLGFGLSLILRHGGTIDGSEILAHLIVGEISKKMHMAMGMSAFLLGFNVAVYAVVFFVINRNSALLSLLVYVIATAIVDHFTDRYEAIKQINIITKQPDAVVKYIKDDMKRTCTIIDSHGAVAGDNKLVIFFASYFELSRFRNAIGKLDNTAFITVTTIDEIMKIDGGK